MAQEVMELAHRRDDHSLAGLYRAMAVVIALTYQQQVAQRTYVDAILGGARPVIPKGDNYAQQALAALNAKDTEILQYTYWDGLSTAEIAEVRGASIQQVATELARAESRFTEKFWRKTSAPESANPLKLLAEARPGAEKALGGDATLRPSDPSALRLRRFLREQKRLNEA
ncbi:MAG: hypothetical protein LBR20_04580, partial [Propionibacteriaceae bacterium]|nr:hypothetical protein [Propionibacteriaceae bacterium]